MTGLAIYRSITLTQGKVAWVDQADYAGLAQSKWYAQKRPHGRFYACRKVRDASGKQAMEQMHRRVLGLTEGDGFFADHVNGDGLDNRRRNLRACTPGENLCNVVGRSGSSRFKGVSFDFRKGLWHAQVSRAQRKHHLGFFTNEQDAARAYDQAALRLHGEFARLNFPQENIA